MAVYKATPVDDRVNKVSVHIGPDHITHTWGKPVSREVARDRALQMVHALIGERT